MKQKVYLYGGWGDVLFAAICGIAMLIMTLNIIDKDLSRINLTTIGGIAAFMLIVQYLMLLKTNPGRIIVNLLLLPVKLPAAALLILCVTATFSSVGKTFREEDQRLENAMGTVATGLLSSFMFLIIRKSIKPH